MNTPIPPPTDPAARQLELFRRSPMRQTLLNEITRLTQSSHPRRCLEIGCEGGAFSYFLRKTDDEWHTLLTVPDAVTTTRALTPERVELFTPPHLPFEDKAFDLVLVVDLIEIEADRALLIEECHRVLQPSGCIALNVPYAGRWSPLQPLRRFLNRRYPAESETSREFSEEDLFGLLKMGFDVIETRSYTRFFAELTRIYLESALRAIPSDATDRFEQTLRLNRMAHPFFRIAFQLDYLLYPFRGNHLVALARRHSWRPRNSPVLKDADSITGAMLSTVR